MELETKATTLELKFLFIFKLSKLFILEKNVVFEMSGSYEESDLKAGFYYDLKFVVSLLYTTFIVVFAVFEGLSAFTDFAVSILLFLCIMTYLDLQEFIEVRVPRCGWKCSKKNYKFASALLMISLFLTPMGKYFLDSGSATRIPLVFFLSVALMLIPMLLGMIFTLTCYLDFGSPPRLKGKDKEITTALLKHSYFYRKIFGRKLTRTMPQ
ncbi:MAG: hypothetical protein QXG66_04915 [Candidatus Bathyarchaeia archaeon]